MKVSVVYFTSMWLFFLKFRITSLHALGHVSLIDWSPVVNLRVTGVAVMLFFSFWNHSGVINPSHLTKPPDNSFRHIKYSNPYSLMFSVNIYMNIGSCGCLSGLFLETWWHTSAETNDGKVYQVNQVQSKKRKLKFCLPYMDITTFCSKLYTKLHLTRFSYRK